MVLHEDVKASETDCAGLVSTMKVEPYPKSDGKSPKDDTAWVASFTVLLPTAVTNNHRTTTRASAGERSGSCQGRIRDALD